MEIVEQVDLIKELNGKKFIIYFLILKIKDPYFI